MSFLPSNATDFERALEEAMSESAILGPAIDMMKGVKYARPLNQTVAPWLIEEYGLGPISQFFVSGAATGYLLDGSGAVLTDGDGVALTNGAAGAIEELIEQGRAWQRIRGTPQAIINAMAWIGYDQIQILDQVSGRRRWHLYQIEMGELPGSNEAQRLADAEYLAGLSDPARSFFWRGFHGYDVRGHVWGRSRWGRSIWGDSSGVRIAPGKTKWSHGRKHAGAADVTQEFLASLGFDYEQGGSLTWDPDLTWGTPGISWGGVDDINALRASLITGADCFVGVYRSNNTPIGYARVLVERRIINRPNQTDIIFDARTGFGDGAGQDAAYYGLAFGGAPADGVDRFQRWLLPEQIAFPAGQKKIGAFPLNVRMGATIREFFRVTLTLPS